MHPSRVVQESANSFPFNSPSTANRAMLLHGCGAQSWIRRGRGEDHVYEGIRDSWYAKVHSVDKQILW